MKEPRNARLPLALAAVLSTLGAGTPIAGAAAEQCAELRTAYQDLKAKHTSLRQDRARQTGLFIPVPRSAMGEQLDCKTMATLYDSLAKSFTALSLDVAQSRDAARAKVEQEQASARAKVEQRKKDTFARGDTFQKHFRNEAVKQMKAVEAFLGADSATDAQVRLDDAMKHLKTMQALIKGFLDPLPSDFENPHTDLPLPSIGSARVHGTYRK